MMPTLLVRGGLSDVLSEEGAQSFLATCPHKEYVNVQGAAHMVAGDRNDIVADAAIQFLARAIPAGERQQSVRHAGPHHEGSSGDVIDVP
jgi:non-heme chloroperoxidase